MLTGLMMDYQLTIDRVLEHGNRLYPHKKIRTKLPDGALHEYSFRDFYGRVKRLCNVLEGLALNRGTGSALSPGTTTSTWSFTSARRARAQWCIRSTFASFPISWPTSSSTPRIR